MVNSMTRFLAVDSAKVDLKERKDKLNNSKTEYLSLDDIRGYKVYTALLTQSGTDAPVATVLENTIGDIVWTRFNTGEYLATLAGAFIDGKTYINIGQNVTYGIGTGAINTTENTLNTIRVNSSSDFAGFEDDILTNTPIEIRVYN